ncbi:MAG: NTP transferase domain-containing protein [Thermomicrobiales bacterium]|nr:NTP transferase domain-containing protein [Thermomicrobiales bacterium]
MDVILPVAGLGTRLRPQTWSKPKPLVSVAGKPMLGHVIDRVLEAEPERLVFITGYLGDQIEAWAAGHVELPVSFVEQPYMRGQTDAIIRARDIVQGDALILFPDMLFEADLSGLRDVDADVVMFTKEVEDPSALGIAVVEDSRIVKLVEKPKEPISNLAVIGIYYFRHMPALYSAIEEQMQRGIALKNEYFLADAIQLMIDRGAVVVPKPVTEWEDCGSAENLLATNRFLLERQPRRELSHDGAVVIHPSYVDESACVENSVIGPYASIGPRVTVRNSIVRNSIVEEAATIGEAHLDSALVGRRATVSGMLRQLNIGDDAVVMA